MLQLQGLIEQAEQQGLQYLQYVNARLIQPILDRVDGGIRAEAAAQSIDLVIPNTANNAPVVLYASERVVDITEAGHAPPRHRPRTRRSRARRRPRPAPGARAGPGN